jgi:hypothetical protein
VPPIFLRNGYHIGGCDDLEYSVRRDTLDLLIEANIE